MAPIILFVAFVGSGLIGLALTVGRSEVNVGRARDFVRSAADRALPPDQERATDRVADEVCRAVGAQLRRGGRPRTVKVRLGALIFQTTAPGDDVAPLTTALRAELAALETPLDLGDCSIAVTCDPSLEATKVVVAVSGRGTSPTPQPRFHDPQAEVQQDPVRDRRPTLRLRPLVDGLPELVVEVTGRELTVGRENCDLKLPESSAARYGTSRVHAVLQGDLAVGSLRIRDNDSTHHVFVNGDEVASATAHHLDTIALGRAEWLLILEDAS